MEIVFGKEWFARNQRKLLFMLNNPVTKDWFRWIMGIGEHTNEMHDLPIYEIGMNHITWLTDFVGDRPVFTSTFYSKRPFADRLYNSFYPMWNAMHIVDEAVLDKYWPEFSFGFSTLTAYPSSGANSPVDGYVGRSPATPFESWSAIHDAASGTSYSNTASLLNQIQSESSAYSKIYRGFALFDTSSLTSQASISTAILSFYGQAKLEQSPLTGSSLNVFSATPGSTSTLANSDYSQVGSTQFSSDIAHSSFSTSGYNDFTLNSSGISNISKTGISKFSYRNSNWDAANVAPSYSSSKTAYQQSRSADAGSGYEPKLVITYTLAVGVPIFDPQYRRRWR